MNLFNVWAIVAVLAAAASLLNRRILRLPATAGVLALALAGSGALLAADHLAPSWGLRAALADFLTRVDFGHALLGCLLCFLLFAGSLHLRLEDLRRETATLVALATFSVALSTALVGALSFVVFRSLGLDAPLPLCLVFGALISPTDPIAVLALLKELGAPRDLDALIAGESLFNDGAGVVAFLALAGAAGLRVPGAVPGSGGPAGPAWLLLRQVGGGLLVGCAAGWAAGRVLKGADQTWAALLITVAGAMAVYALCGALGYSGPLAVVAAGLASGDALRRGPLGPRAAECREGVRAFWGATEDLLNAALFLLLGLTASLASPVPRGLAAAAAIVPLVLAARWLTVLLPVGLLRRGRAGGGWVPILTWGGLRGALSVAMALSLPPIPQKGLLLSCTFAVVLFSVLVQGPTMPRLLRRHGIGGGRALDQRNPGRATDVTRGAPKA